MISMAFVPSSFINLRPFPRATHTVTSVRRPRFSPVNAQLPKSQPKTTTQPKPKPKLKPAKTTTSVKDNEYYGKSQDFLLSLGLSIEDTCRVLSRLPKLSLTADLQKESSEIIRYLRQELRLSRRQLTQAIRFAPHILYRSPRNEKFKAQLDFLESVARIPSNARAGAIARCPHILWMDLKSACQVVQTVIDACPLISPTSLGSVFSRVPHALILSPGSISENILKIRQAGGVCDSASMARIISKAPLSLVYDSKNTIDKRLKYLSNELSLPLSTIGKVLIALPQILHWSVDKILRPRIKLLQSIVGGGRDDVVNIVDKIPMILGVDDAIDRVLWLRENVNLNDDQIRLVIREAPAVLTYSVVCNLAPKWAFAKETMGATAEDVVSVPREMLCANLQQRAMPRYAFLASMGRADQVSVIDILKGSDAEYCKHVAQCDPAHFREYVDNDTYLLFFSQLM